MARPNGNSGAIFNFGEGGIGALETISENLHQIGKKRQEGSNDSTNRRNRRKGLEVIE
jgi:hypothetical protein